jgi:hypothetical protein
MLRPFRLLALAALALAAAGFAGGAHAQGVLYFETLSHDFGSVQEGEKPSYTFVFTNTGDQPLRLLHVRPSCGCTTPSYSTESIGPGEQGEIVVEYDSQGRPGDFKKHIDVEAEGAEPPSARLEITGNVIPASVQNGVAQGNVSFDADTHTYPSLKADEPASHVFRMQNVGERPIRIEDARSFPAGAEVTYPDRPIFPEEVVEIAVTVPDVGAVADAQGAMDVAVVLHTTDEAQPAKSLRLRGQVVPAATETASGTE